MIVKSCLPCPFHQIKEGPEAQMSYCQKENCWSRFSKCIAIRALQNFLEQEGVEKAHICAGA